MGQNNENYIIKDSIGIHQNELFANSFHSTRDIIIQSRVSRLKDGRVELFPTHKKIRWINLSDIENSVDRDLNCRSQAVNRFQP